MATGGTSLDLPGALADPLVDRRVAHYGSGMGAS
jgi:hypothetical protein